MDPTFDHPRHQKVHHQEEEHEILDQAEQIETADKDITPVSVVAAITEIHPIGITKGVAQEVGKGTIRVIEIHMVP